MLEPHREPLYYTASQSRDQWLESLALPPPAVAPWTIHESELEVPNPPQRITVDIKKQIRNLTGPGSKDNWIQYGFGGKKTLCNLIPKYLNQPFVLYKLLQHLLSFFLPHLLAFKLINQVQNICGRCKATF